jgi:hypothetical protein
MVAEQASSTPWPEISGVEPSWGEMSLGRRETASGHMYMYCTTAGARRLILLKDGGWRMGAEGHQCMCRYVPQGTYGMAVVVTRTCNPVDTVRKGPVQVQGYHPRPWLLYIQWLRTECSVHSKICTQLSSLPPTPRKRVSPSSIEKVNKRSYSGSHQPDPRALFASHGRHTRKQKSLMRLPVLNLLFLAPVIGNSKWFP